MAERRSLVEGITTPEPPLDPVKAKEFVFGKNRPVNEATTTPASASSPVSTRIRTDFAEALKQASLDRQIKKRKPNTIRDILEEALEPWLKGNGYIP